MHVPTLPLRAVREIARQLQMSYSYLVGVVREVHVEGKELQAGTRAHTAYLQRDSQHCPMNDGIDVAPNLRDKGKRLISHRCNVTVVICQWHSGASRVRHTQQAIVHHTDIQTCRVHLREVVGKDAQLGAVDAIHLLDSRQPDPAQHSGAGAGLTLSACGRHCTCASCAS
jgi:hypothetical protein